MSRSWVVVVLCAAACEVTTAEPPVAVCLAPTGIVARDTELVFDGSQSHPADPGPIATFAWTLVSAPPEVGGRLEGTDQPRASIVADVFGEYVVELVVTDFGGNESEPCTASYTVDTEVVDCPDGSQSSDHPDGVCPPTPLTPAVVLFDTYFGYDADAGVVRSYELPTGETVWPQVVITLGSEVYNPNDVATYCTIRLEVQDDAIAPNTSWTTDATGEAQEVLVGFDVPSSMVIDDGCANRIFDPEVWGDGPVATLQAHQWGAGVSTMGEPLFTDLEEYIVSQAGQAAWDDEWLPYLFGGGYYRNDLVAEGLAGGYVNEQYGFANAVDDAWVVEWTDSNDSGEYEDGQDELTLLTGPYGGAEALPSGAYSMQAGYYTDASCLIAAAGCLGE